MASSGSVFTEYLRVLGVPHTNAYSTRRYRAYPRHMALTAMYDLLREYKAAPEIADVKPSAEALAGVKVPFVAQTADGCRIVTEVSPKFVSVIGPHDAKAVIMPVGKFVDEWSGKAISASPTSDSGETNFKSHRFKELSRGIEKWLLVVCVVFLVGVFAVSGHTFGDWSTGAVCVLNAVGIYVCYLLILKDAHVDSRAADSVCGVIQSHGCSTVLSHDASVFLGLFPWCQIGITYFSVSFVAMLVYPPCLPYLAVASACCLPYTVWSVCYQKFRIHAWCTLCLCVQTIFWLEFLVYLAGGHFHGVFPLRFDLVVLLACYLAVLLAVNRIIPRIFGAEMSDADTLAASSQTSVKDMDDKSGLRRPSADDTAGIHVTLS